jgi:hypothetical protein
MDGVWQLLKAAASQVQAGDGCQLADGVRQLMEADAAAQVQAAEGCQLADGVRQLLQAEAVAQIQAGEGCSWPMVSGSGCRRLQ